VIEAPQWRRAGVLPAGLQGEAEGVLPLPASELHLVCVPVEEGRLLVCGAPRADLNGLADEVATLTPDAVPACLGVPAAAPDLNLLVGEFEPGAVARARARVHLLGMAAAALIAALVTIGLQRRAAAWEGFAREAAGATSALLRRHAAGRSPEQLSLDLERRKREVVDAPVLTTPDEAAPVLVQVLRGWPTERPAKPLSLNITPRSAALSLVVQGDPSGFIEGFRPPAGWSLEEPRVSAAGDTTRVSLQLHDSKEGAR
jgi:hypothetical protein